MTGELLALESDTVNVELSPACRNVGAPEMLAVLRVGVAVGLGVGVDDGVGVGVGVGAPPPLRAP